MNQSIKIVALCAAIAIVQCVPYGSEFKRSISEADDILENEISNVTNSTGKDL
jgi:predicted HAD superfamily phosphohydrolase